MEVGEITNQDGTLSAEIVGSNGNSYVVIITEEGDFYCSCLDAFMRKRRCKHIGFLLDGLNAGKR